MNFILDSNSIVIQVSASSFRSFMFEDLGNFDARDNQFIFPEEGGGEFVVKYTDITLYNGTAPVPTFTAIAAAVLAALRAYGSASAGVGGSTSANQTNGTQKTQIVDPAGTVASVETRGTKGAQAVEILDAAGAQITTFGGPASGDVAEGSSDSGNPVKIGGKARTVRPAAQSDGYRINAYFDEYGRLGVVEGTPIAPVTHLIDSAGSRYGTAAYTTSNTITVTGFLTTVADPTVYIVWIKYKANGSNYWKTIRNSAGYSITASANVITVTGTTAFTGFAASDSYLIGVNYSVPSMQVSSALPANFWSPANGSLAYLSASTLTASGFPFTVDSASCALLTLGVTNASNVLTRYENGVNGISLYASSGTVTIYQYGVALSAFLNTDTSYKIAINYEQKGFDQGSNSLQTTQLNPDFLNFSGPEVSLGAAQTLTGSMVNIGTPVSCASFYNVGCHFKVTHQNETTITVQFLIQTQAGATNSYQTVTETLSGGADTVVLKTYAIPAANGLYYINIPTNGTVMYLQMQAMDNSAGTHPTIDYVEYTKAY